MGISLKEITDTITDQTTGEVLHRREYREVKINNTNEPPFIKSYRGTEGGDIRKINDVPIGLWVIILDNMGSENEIRIGTRLKKSMAEEMNRSIATIERHIQRLMEYNMLRRKLDEQGKPIQAEYIVCPYISAIGKWKDIYERQNRYSQCNSVIRYNVLPAIKKKNYSILPQKAQLSSPLPALPFLEHRSPGTQEHDIIHN